MSSAEDSADWDDGVEQTAPVWAVFGDLMSGLLGAFVLVLVGVLVVQMDLVTNLQAEVAKRQSEEQRRMALWRCRRSFASIERRHASDCAASMRERLRAGDSSGASDAARLCGRHWGRYVALRLGRGPTELPCYRPDTVPAAPISHPSV